MKRIAIVLAVLALCSSGIQAQQSMSFGISRTSLSAVSGGAGTVGTAFAAPPGGDAALITWTASYSAPPASVTMLLEASLNNSTWFTLDSSTAVGGEIRVIASSANFYRCNISAVSGAVNKTCSFVLRRTNSATQGSTFAGNVTAGGEFLASNGTAALPSYSFTSEPGLGWYRGSTGWLGFANDNGTSLNPASFGPSSLLLGSTYALGWNNVTTTLGGAPDLTLRRSGAGTLLLGNAYTSTDFGLLQFGGTTSAFPALKRSSNGIHIRLADDSGYAPVIMSSLGLNVAAPIAGLGMDAVLFASLGAPANGTFIYCSDCLANSSPCSGASTGALAKRLNGVWDCR